MATAAVPLRGLKSRPEFLRTARGRSVAMPGFVLQARPGEPGKTAGYGITCSKKVGNAVARNRAKRRLRALAKSIMPDHARPGWAYVLIGRAGRTAGLSFAQMQQDLRTALARVHGPAA
ncbi:MAG: ribonuclease P protein component [Pseudomonadota bacterium]